METMTQNSIKYGFASYLQKRGYKIVQGTMKESDAGVSAQITQQQQPSLQHFTGCTMVNPRTWQVRISVKDYDNQAITDGLL